MHPYLCFSRLEYLVVVFFLINATYANLFSIAVAFLEIFSWPQSWIILFYLFSVIWHATSRWMKWCLRLFLQVTRECLYQAISTCGPGVEFNRIGKTIQYGVPLYSSETHLLAKFQCIWGCFRATIFTYAYLMSFIRHHHYYMLWLYNMQVDAYPHNHLLASSA